MIVVLKQTFFALHYLLDNIFIRFGSKLYRQIVGIPMVTNCAPLVADLFLFFMRETSCCLCQTIIKLTLLKLLTPPPDIKMTYLSLIHVLIILFFFEQMVGQIYPTELRLNKANSSDTEAPFLDLNLSITNGIVSTKIYDKRDDFNFEIVRFPFLD